MEGLELTGAFWTGAVSPSVFDEEVGFSGSLLLSDLASGFVSALL